MDVAKTPDAPSHGGAATPAAKGGPFGGLVAGGGLFGAPTSVSANITYEIMADFAGDPAAMQPALRQGEHVNVSRDAKEENGWLWGKKSDGTAGYLPGTFLKKVESVGPPPSPGKPGPGPQHEQRFYSNLQQLLQEVCAYMCILCNFHMLCGCMLPTMYIMHAFKPHVPQCNPCRTSKACWQNGEQLINTLRLSYQHRSVSLLLTRSLPVEN